MIKQVLLPIIFMLSNAGIYVNVGTELNQSLSAQVFVDAPILLFPGDSISITVKFDRPMDDACSPVAAFSIDNRIQQNFSKGQWSADNKLWVFDKEMLGQATGLGRLTVEGAKSKNGLLMAIHEEKFIIGHQLLLSKLEEIGSWMLGHRHEVIFVEGYDYRTFLALYEITAKQDYLDAARKGVEHLLSKQHPYGHWSTGYGSTYLADAGSALGALINFYKYATLEEQKRIDDALYNYYEMMLVKGDGAGESFIHNEGYLGVGFKDYKQGKVIDPLNNPYTISTALSGGALFAAANYMDGKESYKDIAVNAVNWLLATQNEKGVFPYIIDDWDKKRENIWKEYLHCSSSYVGEGLIAAYIYLDDQVLNKKIEKALSLHIEWLLETQNTDGSWGEDKTFNSTRSHGVVNVLSWYYNHVQQEPRVSAAIRSYYLLLMDKERNSYHEIARHPIQKWDWKVAGEYVSTALASRALAEIIKPGIDCYRWKDVDISKIATSYNDPSNRKVTIPPPIITPWDDLLYGVKSREDWHKKKKELRERFLKLLGDDAKPEKRPLLDITIHESVNVEAVYKRKLISYNVESDERVWAYLTFPVILEKGERCPAVVVLHGTAVEGKDVVAGFMPRPIHKGQGHMDDLARRGYVTIAPDHFNMGQRLPPDGNYHTDLLYERHPGWSALGKIIYDASVAIDVLGTLESVDTTRIGVIGHSLGGTGAIYLAAYDHRVIAAACNDGSYPFRFNTRIEQFIRPGGQYSYFPNLRPLIQEGKLQSIDIHEIAALIAPRAYLDNISLNDIYGPSEEGHNQRVLMDLRLADVWQLEQAAANFAFYVRSQEHSCQHDNNELMYAWLDKHLNHPRAKLLRKVEK